MTHLFPGDHDEHGAVVVAGIQVLAGRVRLLVRDVELALDNVDHVPGTRGYKMLKAQFIRNYLVRARDERLVYLSVHNHGGFDRVAFSRDDIASHERGYPALLDIVKGMPVGALVFAAAAIAGEIWLPNGARVPLRQAIVVGSRRAILSPEPIKDKSRVNSSLYDRQVRLFGEAGQQILQKTKVGIVGLGGIGSQLAELLGRLGVGNFVLVDPQRADITNLPRLIGARRSDVLMSEKTARRFGKLQLLLDRLRRRKIDLAARNILRANHSANLTRVFGSIADQKNAKHLFDCDYIFLAADEMIARLVFNSIVNQYLIPGVQVGARVVTDTDTGKITDVFAVSRPVTPNGGCLWCNSLIDPTKLQIEATDPTQARLQDYGTEATAPSVVTLNALAAADAANTFKFYITGLAAEDADQAYVRFRPIRRSLSFDEPRANPRCPECGHHPTSRFARGDEIGLPTR
jgi:hypothetical protein